MGSHGHRILLWSADAACAESVTEALRPLTDPDGGGIHWLESPEEVMAEILDNGADLLIADLGDVSSRAVVSLRNCKRVRPRLPVIVLTSTFEDQFRTEVLPLGIHYYLSRAFEAEELAESARSALKLASLQG